MKQKLPFLLEMIWLLLTISSMLFAMIKTYNVGFNENIMLYVVVILAGLMYGSRRYLRKTRENINQDRK